jgi:FlaA1/EpsC-like NDP-sugar epimerase
MSISAFLGDRLSMPRRGRLVFLHDLVMAALSFVLAMLLRVGGDVFSFFDPLTLLLATLAFTAIAGSVFLLTDLYRGVWRYASTSDMIAVTRAATLTILVFLLVLFTWTRLEPLPRSVPFINWLVLVALLAGPRFFYRLTKDRRMDRRLEAEAGRKIPVLLAGSGSEAELFIRGLRAEQQRVYTIVGIVAEKAKRVGQQIHGVPILGTLADLPQVVAALKDRGQRVERVILTKERADGAAVRRLFDDATALGLTLARLPRLTDFRSGAPGGSSGGGATAEPARLDSRADSRALIPWPTCGRSPSRTCSAGRRCRSIATPCGRWSPGGGSPSPAPAAASAPNWCARSRASPRPNWC